MTSRYIEEENIDEVNQRIDHLLSAYDSDNDELPMEKVSQPAPEFDLSKLAGAFSTMFRPVKEIPKKVPQTYINRVYDILVTNILLVLYYLLPADMVPPAEKLIKERMGRMFQRKIDRMRDDQSYLYKVLLGASAVVYYMYRFRLLVAFANGFFWGAYLV
jgi:hypothetical protein